MIFNNDFGGMGGFGGSGNGGGYRRGNYIGGGYGGLGAFGGNPLGVPMNVGGYFDSSSLYGGYGSMNMQNVGTYLMLEQLMEQGNRSNSSNYNYNSNNTSGFNNQNNNGFNNNNSGFNNQNNNGFNNNNSGFNNQNNNGYNNNSGFNNQNNNGYNNNSGFNNQNNNGYNNNNGFSNQNNNGYNNNNGFSNQNNNGYNNNSGFNNQNNNGYNNNNGFNNQNNNGYNNNGFNNQNNNGYNNNNGFNNNVPNRAAQPPLGPANGNQQGGFSSSQPARNPSAAATTNLPKPKRRRPGVANPGAPLMKGQKIPITGSGRLKIGLGWDVNDSRCDLDASAFMLDKNNRIVGDEWFIFYGQDTSPDSSVQYKVFDISVACEDDAELTIDLNKVSPNVEKILIAITIYEASANRLNFGMVQNVYARIMDADTGKETTRFVQDECYSNVTALVLGELYRYKGAWKFNAVGSGVARDLAEFCAMYGVVME